MGKGDRRTAKGKRFSSSYGNKRQRGKSSIVAPAAATPKAPVARKTAAKKKA